MRVAHLCNGLGGSLWTGAILGWKSVYALDHDPWRCDRVRQQVAAGWWPWLRVDCADLATWDPAAAGLDDGVDCLAAGFSCCDISAAGGGRGITGPSTGPTYSGCIRAIQHLRPAWVFFENSPRIRTKGRHVVTADLVALGYRWRDGTLDASDVGAPHQRRRWFCLAVRADIADTAGCGSPDHRLLHQQGTKDPASERSLAAVAAGAGCAIAAPADALRHRLQESIQRGGLSTAGSEAIQAAARHCEAHAWNPFNPRLLRVVDGVADRQHRIAALGDGWVPAQAAAAWRLLGGPMSAGLIEHPETQKDFGGRR